MDMKEFDRKTYIADSAQAFADRRITKRQFLRRLAIAGVGLSSFAATMLGDNVAVLRLMRTISAHLELEPIEGGLCEAVVDLAA